MESMVPFRLLQLQDGFCETTVFGAFIVALALRSHGRYVHTLFSKTRLLTSHQIPFTSIQFPLYKLLKRRLAGYLDRNPLYAHEAALCGSIAGGVAAVTTTPLDVLKTRVMLDMRVSYLHACQTAFLMAVPPCAYRLEQKLLS